MKKKLTEKLKESLASVLPITAVVFILSVTVTPMPVGTLMLFMIGAVLLVLGMGFFVMGADMFLVPVGEDVGIKMTASRKLFLVITVSLAMGFIITVAEPDLQVLAGLVPNVPNMILILAVAGGVGVMLLVSVLRILLRVSLSKILIVLYSAVIIVSFFTPNNFVSIAFDSGGVTTGPITVPFILAMGLGLASVRSDKDSAEDSFGLVALCSIGPILAVMILGMFYKMENTEHVLHEIPEIVMSRDALLAFAEGLPYCFKNVAVPLLTIFAAVLVFQFFTRRYHARQFLRIFIGFLYTFLGLVLFLTGVDVGFIPVGQNIGSYLANSDIKWLLIPLGAVVGYFIVAAEPAVHVLKKQIEEVSGGGIPGHAVQRYLAVGTAGALAISMLRVLTGISVYWFLIPGYVIAIVLTFFVPKIFTGIAFDSGGVVSGPMTSTFLLPFAIGACADPDRIMTDAFGLVAMVAMTPLIAIQLMGVIYKKRIDEGKEADSDIEDSFDESGNPDEIIDYIEHWR